MAEEPGAATKAANNSVPGTVIPGLGDLPVSDHQALKRELVSEDENVSASVTEDSDDIMKEEPDSGTPPPKKKRRPNRKRGGKLGAQTLRGPKNALMQLNEIRPGLNYEVVSQEGPTHCPTFVVSVVVDGHAFEGRGTTKQKAKHNAADNALRSFITQMRTPAQRLLTESQGVVTDFTSDSTGTLLNTFGNGEQPMPDSETESPMASESTTPSNKVKSPKVQTDAGKHPVMLLNEFHPGLQYEFLGEEGDQNSKQFRFKVIVDGQEFVGMGSSKKKGKANVASKALFALHSIRTFYTFTGQSEARSKPTFLGPPPSAQLDQMAADLIADAVLTKFQSLQATVGEEPIRRKVLASIVMTSRGDSDQKFEVISLGTGTKFISGEYISDQGLALNDCHGEIIARRSFLRFLYSQLELCAEGYEEDSIFEKKESGLYGLRDYVEFHLYINTSPCGDARVFSPHEPITGEVDKHPGRKKRGLLRVKLENGEGMFSSHGCVHTIPDWFCAAAELNSVYSSRHLSDMVHFIRFY